MDEEFLEVYRQFVEQWKKPQPIPEFRIYYESQTGKILYYSMENIPGDYILVDKDTWHENRYDLRVQNGRLVKPEPMIVKLRPSTSGTSTHPQDISIICENSKNYWSVNAN